MRILQRTKEHAKPRTDAEPMGVLAASRGWQIAACGFFLLLIVAVPVSQALIERQRGEGTQELSIFEAFPTLPCIEAYERALKRNSWVGKAVRRNSQWALL